MFIEEVIIEGFKSYATRTVISNWDREFNAITGLNGSGKSNILDAICFVLGLENLKQVRAATLQDLVYKRGQAGISKASVTIIFNNENKAKSPVGFADCQQITVTRQIIIGGKNKYLINGHNVPQKSIENLFQSVGLNINNPHFLIMQGQITKVLNMKPVEILSLLEEAAGTRMFEDRKEKAITTFEKKEGKIKEISDLLNEIIIPKLDKLREERADFVEYQKLEAEIEKLKRASIANEYFTNRNLFESSNEKVVKLEEEIIEKIELEKGLKENLKSIEDEMNKIISEQKASKKSSHVESLEAKLKEVSNELVRMKTKCEIENEQIQSDKKALANLKTQLKQKMNDKKSVESSKSLIQDVYGKRKREFEEKSAKIKKLEDLLQSLLTGVSSKDGQEGGFIQLIRETKEEINSKKAKIEQLKMKMNDYSASLKEMTPKAKNAQKIVEKLEKENEVLEKEVNSLQTSLDEILENGTEKDLAREVEQKKREFMDVKSKLSNLEAKSAGLWFNINDLGDSVDKSKVRGTVGSLIDVCESYSEYSRAVEICAGGRLYNLIVDNEKIGSQILDNSRLGKRVTIIPLNKISSYKVPRETVEYAKKLAPGKVELALNVVKYEKTVEAAMEYVFGGVFVCKDKETANLIAFDKNIRTKCITVDGDVYDPSGTLTGGSSNSNNQSLLSSVKDTKDLKIKLLSIQKELSTLEAKLDQVGELQKILGLKKHKLSISKKEMMNDQDVKLIASVSKLSDSMKEIEVELNSLIEEVSKREKELASFEKDSKEFDVNKSDKLKKLEKELKDERSNFEKIRSEFTKVEKDFHIFKSNEGNEEEELAELSSKIISLEESSQRKESKVPKELSMEYEQLEAALRKEYEIRERENLDFKKCEKHKKLLIDSLGECQIILKQAQVEISKLKSLCKESQAVVVSFEKKHPFLLNLSEEEKALLLKKKETAEQRSYLASLEDRHAKLSRKINMQVMDLIDRIEKKEVNLKSMVSTVKKDRLKIENTIDKLNEYKKETLMKTWTKVNTDFGQIFSDLLPGAFAKLEPNGSIMDGILVKVCLGGIWKNSLTELSGGQRSLVALSLILALLQYNPAPMYILDEVDAALDLSHTQNIGNLLKSRFKGSQFIVVSLKDGMFNNANCLFKTKFKEGISFVERFSSQTAKSAVKSAVTTKKTKEKALIEAF